MINELIHSIDRKAINIINLDSKENDLENLD